MLEYTGERYMPCVTGQYKYEHLHRYALSRPLVAGRTVLDIASGEGYGAALLAGAARSVIGVDIDEASVAHARTHYAARTNLEFRQGSCAAIPLPDRSVEVVTSFETIEHHDQHEEMLAEIKRVLVPGGLLVISSPNKLVYSDLPQVTNHFHVKELYFDELTQLLGRYFQQQRLFGQRLATGSFVYDLQETDATSLQVYSGDTQTLRTQVAPLNDTVYFIALASDDPAQLNAALASVFIEPGEDLLKLQSEQHAAEVRAVHDWRKTWEGEVQAALAQQAEEVKNYYEQHFRQYYEQHYNQYYEQHYRLHYEQHYRQHYEQLYQPRIAALEAEAHKLYQEMERLTSSRAYKLVQQIWRWRARLGLSRAAN